MAWTRSLRVAAAAAIIGAASLGSAYAQSDPAQIIRERREGLRAVGQHMEAILAIVQSRGDARAAVPRVEAMQAFFATFPTRFPPGTQAGETRALPAIWTDAAGFTAAYNGTVAALGNLRMAAASGDVAALGQAVQATGATCATCHRPYRAR